MLTAHQVGRFELRDFLGRGAIGDVYLAWDPEGGREVALKVVRIHRCDPEMLEAEKNGVALQKQLSAVAPQVAAVYEWGENDGFFWVAMEYVAGSDLSEALARGPMLEDKAAAIAQQLCEMLEVCHQYSAEIGGRKFYGIVHGDVKPENIRLQDGDGGNRVRVLDFGIAKHLSQTRRFTVNLFGSLPYTPPERLDRGGVDSHSDLWAVGVVLYLMVAGYPPFTSENAEDLEAKIRSGQPPQPLPESTSPGLRKIVEKSLSFEVSRRYAAAVEMKADLAAWQEGKPLPSEAPRDEPERETREDLNTTRRTRPPLDDSGSFRSSETRRTAAAAAAPENDLGATRRTTEPLPLVPPAPPEAPAAAASAPAAEPPPAPPPSRSPRWPQRLVVVALAVVVLLAAQVWVRSEASQIQRDLATENADLDELWNRYQRIAPFNLPGTGLSDVRLELKEAMLKSADRILESYHGDAPITTERGWQKAQDHLKAAVDLDHRDRSARAKMLYTRGHLDRIASQTLRGKGQRREAQERVRDAVYKFEESAKLAPEWPDPYLGLARIYAYERFDLANLESALSELERRGYSMGRREKAMLADGYRMQGLNFKAQAERNREGEEETGLLEQARDHFTQALALYHDIPNFADVRTNSAATEERLDEVMERLWELGAW